jgi:hypothetical protein
MWTVAITLGIGTICGGLVSLAGGDRLFSFGITLITFGSLLVIADLFVWRTASHKESASVSDDETTESIIKDDEPIT